MALSSDSALSMLINRNFKILSSIIVTPELEIVNNMEEAFGNEEGSWYYGGLRLRANFGFR